MKPIVLKADADGTIKITAEEVRKMVEEAYETGYADGRASVPQQITVPQWPTSYPTWLQSPIVTCTTETTTTYTVETQDEEEI